MATTYGTGTAGQFTDASARQVLELGKKVHMYNPDVTPIYTVAGRSSTMVTPVPIFEWMEDEYMIKKDVTLSITAALTDDVTGANDAQEDQNIVICERLAQLEAFEVGAIYKATVSGGSAAQNEGDHVMCVRIGKNCEHASATDLMVQFVGMHAHATIVNAWNVEANANGVNLFTADAAGVLKLEYVTNGGQYYDAGVAVTNTWGNNLTDAQIKALADADYFQGNSGGVGWAEGASVGVETKKKVRRLKNCTQIFREPYTITGTANAAKYYGGPELARLQARKLAKIKGDVEYALLAQGAIALDGSAENPTRTFQGFGIGLTDGVVQTLNGASNTDMQVDESTQTLDAMDGLCENIFHDMVSGSMKKTVFCSNRWLKYMTICARKDASTQLVAEMGSDATAGLRVTKFYGPVGELEFIPHPLLNNALDVYALAIDFNNFNMRPLNSRDMQLRSDIVKDGHDGRTDEWLMEFGPEIRNEQTHAILKLV